MIRDAVLFEQSEYAGLCSVKFDVDLRKARLDCSIYKDVMQLGRCDVWSSGRPLSASLSSQYRVPWARNRVKPVQKLLFEAHFVARGRLFKGDCRRDPSKTPKSPVRPCSSLLNLTDLTGCRVLNGVWS